MLETAEVFRKRPQGVIFTGKFSGRKVAVKSKPCYVRFLYEQDKKEFLNSA